MTYDSEMTALADAIRSKANITGTLTVSGMRAAVADLSVGGGISPDVRTLSVTPSKSQQNFTSSELGANAYYGTVTVEPIPSEYITTDDATAVSGDILAGKTAYVKGEKVTGTLQSVTATLSGNVVTVPPGVIAEAQTLTVPEAQAPTLSGNAVTVYSGYISATQTVTIGTAKEAETFTPGTSDITIPADTYLTGAQVIRGDGALTPENIKTGISIFGVEGNFTADADATASDIAQGKIAYVKGAKVSGKMPRGTIVQNGTKVTVTAGYVPDGVLYIGTAWSEHFGFNPIVPGKNDFRIDGGIYMDIAATVKGDANLVPGNIAAGVSIFNVEGTFTSDADATAYDIVEGRTAYVNGVKIEGSMSFKSAETYTPGTADITIRRGVYLDGDQTIKGDANLKAENIAEGVTLFGVAGSFTGGQDTSDATVTAADLLEGVTAYGAEGKVTGTISTVTPSLEGNVFTVPSGFIAEPQTLTAGTVKLAETYTPGTADITIPANLFLAEAQTIKGDANLKAENIAKGVSIFNVEGSFTSDATAVSGDILAGKTAYVKGEKVTGTLQSVTATLSGNVVTVPPGVITEAQTLTVPEAQAPTLSGNAVTVYSGYIRETQTVTVGTAKEAETFTPGTSAITIPADTYLTGAQVIRGDGALTPKNIKTGVSIFGVEGNFTADADATASDIASGKTAYVKGQKITGTASGEAVVPLWYHSGWNMQARVPACKNFGVPARERADNFKTFKGGLWWFSDSYLPQQADSEIYWTYVYTKDYESAIAIGDGKLYKVSPNPITVTPMYPSISNVTQCVMMDWGEIFCCADGVLYAGNNGGMAVRVEYTRNNDSDPMEYVFVTKILNHPQDYNDFWVITADGSLAHGWIDTGSFDGDNPRAYAEIDIQSVANGNPFVNYYPQASDEYSGGSSVTCELAFRADGLWYRQTGKEWRENKYWYKAWTKASDPGFRKYDWLGYCSLSYYENWDTGETSVVPYMIALHIDEEGRLWKIVPTGQMSGYEITMTGLNITQVGEDGDWQCVTPVIRKGQGQAGRYDGVWGQKGGKAVNIRASDTDTIDIAWDEYPVPISGKMVCAEGNKMYFAPERAIVDLSKAGGTF